MTNVAKQSSLKFQGQVLNQWKMANVSAILHCVVTSYRLLYKIKFFEYKVKKKIVSTI